MALAAKVMIVDDDFETRHLLAEELRDLAEFHCMKIVVLDDSAFLFGQRLDKPRERLPLLPLLFAVVEFLAI